MLSRAVAHHTLQLLYDLLGLGHKGRTLQMHTTHTGCCDNFCHATGASARTLHIFNSVLIILFFFLFLFLEHIFIIHSIKYLE
jgi:hypothetical protein